MRFRNGIFIITEDNHCPLYNVGEELKIDEGVLTLPVAKPTCMVLANELIRIASEDDRDWKNAVYKRRYLDSE